MYGNIFAGIRDTLSKNKFFKDLFTCALCTGFWAGLLIGTVSTYNPLVFALYSSSICFILHLVTEIMLNKAYSKDSEQTSLDSQVDE